MSRTFSTGRKFSSELYLLAIPAVVFLVVLVVILVVKTVEQPDSLPQESAVGVDNRQPEHDVLYASRIAANEAMCATGQPEDYRIFTEDTFLTVNDPVAQNVVGYHYESNQWVPVSSDALVQTKGTIVPTHNIPVNTVEPTC